MEPMDIVGKAKEDASLPKGMCIPLFFFQICDFSNVKLKNKLGNFDKQFLFIYKVGISCSDNDENY